MKTDLPLRMVVESELHPGSETDQYQVRIVSGHLKTGQSLRVLPSGQNANVAQIHGVLGANNEATEGDSIKITLEEACEISCGSVLCDSDHPVEVADQFNGKPVVVTLIGSTGTRAGYGPGLDHS